MANPDANGASAMAPAPPPGASSDDLRLTLRLISPASDLADFPPLVNVPLSTTIGRVKKRIEDELVARRRAPAGLRLIYRGRVLDNDAKQLQEVFGLTAIRESSTQTLHLVLRETASNATTTAGNTTTTNTAAAAQPSRPANNTQQGAAAGFAHQPPQAQQAHNLLPAGYPGTILRQHLEAHTQALERWRLQNPAQAHVLQAAQPTREPPAVASQPATTSNELSAAEVERILAAAEARTAYGTTLQADGHAAQEQGGQGTAQGHSLAGNAEVYILSSPAGPRALLINGNAAYYSPPPPPPAAAAPGYNPWVANVIQQHNQRAQPMMGQIMHQQLHHMQLLQQLQDRHLRLHMQNFRENRAVTQQQQQQQRLQQLQQQQHEQQQMLLAQQLHPELRQRVHRQPEDPQQAQPGLAAPHAPAGAAPQVLRQGGLQANAGAGFLAAMWPHIWLVARLVLFVWWFTSPTASWSRWIMVVLLAAAVFVANTGMLDGVANQAWAPVRRHIDELLPGADVHGNENGPQLGQANVPAPQAGGAGTGAVPIGRAGGRDPDPAEVAARMVAARQEANGERLMALARRLERVGIMFLASLAPGIAERHVARVEEEERAARLRQQQEAEAAAAAAAEEVAAAATAAATAATAAAAAETAETGKEAEATEAAEVAEAADDEATRDGDEP